MADEKEQAAVEDPIKPGAEGEQEPKAEEPTTEETPEPEGGAVPEQEGEEELDSADALKAVLGDMTPEERRALYDTAYESLSDEDKDGLRPEAESEKANAEAAQRERGVAQRELFENRQRRDAALKAATESYLGGLPTADLYDEGGNKVSSPVDKAEFTKQRDDAYLQGQITFSEQLRGAFGLQVLAVLEESGVTISKEMKELGNSIGDKSYEWFQATVGKAIVEARESAPDSIKAQAKADAEKEAGVVENRTKLVDALGGRRKKKALAGGTINANGAPTPQEYNAATATKRREWRDKGIEPAVPSETQA